MADLLKRTDEFRVNTEEEAVALINAAKANAVKEGYELISYKTVKKEKKSKGEVVESWIIVSLVKQWA